MSVREDFEKDYLDRGYPSDDLELLGDSNSTYIDGGVARRFAGWMASKEYYSPMEENERLKQERDELAAQVEVMRDATAALIAAGKTMLRKSPPETVMEAERQLDVIREGVSKCEAALSNTPSAALLAHENEVAAKVLEEGADRVANFCGCDIPLRKMAAAKRKGEE